MDSGVYMKLRKQLDQWSVGYPSASSGVELQLLEKLFDEKEAWLFLHMNLVLEQPETVAERAGKDATETATLLEQMATKSLLFRHCKGDFIRYSAAPFLLGIYEYQVGRMDQEFALQFETYLQESFYK